jgi:ATP-dependent helicase Lhr and Lhr-like helicase
MLASELSRIGSWRVDHDACTILIDGAEGFSAIERAVRDVTTRDPASMSPSVEEEAIEGLKFSKCLPREWAIATLAARLRDVPSVRSILAQPVRIVSGT